MNKVCTKCGIEKPLDLFRKSARNSSGYGSVCRECALVIERRWKLANPEKQKQAAKNWKKANPKKIKEYKRRSYAKNSEKYKTAAYTARLKRAYGLEVAEYQEMLLKQAGTCAICKQKDSTETLAVDHNHETGEIRGLLCGACNRAIGLLDDSPEVCEAAAMYLRKFSEQSRAEVKQ